MRPLIYTCKIVCHWMTSECMILLSLATNFSEDRGQVPGIWFQTTELDHGVDHGDDHGDDW